MERYLQAIEAKKAPMLAMQGQVQILDHAPGYRPRHMMRVTMTLEGSRANKGTQVSTWNFFTMTSSNLFLPSPRWPGFLKTMAFQDLNRWLLMSFTSKLMGHGRLNHSQQFRIILNFVLVIADANGHLMLQSTPLSIIGLKFREPKDLIHRLSVKQRINNFLKTIETIEIRFVIEQQFFVQPWRTGVDDGTLPLM